MTGKDFTITDSSFQPKRRSSGMFTRYALRQLLVSFLAISLSLAFIVWLTQSLRFIDMIVNRGLPIATFLQFAGLLLPTMLNYVMPLALFVAVMFTYHRLNQDHELVILRAAGVNAWRISRPALWLGLVVFMLSLLTNLYVMPASYRAFKDLQYKIRHDYSITLIQEGVFTNVADGVTVFVRERPEAGMLKGILVQDNRKKNRPVTILAERGYLTKDKGGPKVVVLNGSRQEIDRETGRVDTVYFDDYFLDLRTIDNTSEIRWHEPRERFLPQLFHPDLTNGDDAANETRLIAEGHNRLLTPLYGFLMVGIALTATALSPFSRRGQNRRLLLGSLVALGLQIAALAIVNIMAKLPIIIPVWYAAIILFIFLGAIVILRAGYHQRSLLWFIS